MKEYMKPEAEFVEFASEAITLEDLNGGQGVVSNEDDGAL